MSLAKQSSKRPIDHFLHPACCTVSPNHYCLLDDTATGAMIVTCISFRNQEKYAPPSLGVHIWQSALGRLRGVGIVGSFLACSVDESRNGFGSIAQGFV